MNESVLQLDQFLCWLCEHESDVVGTPGTLMLSPLAEFLAEMTGHVYGVSERRYGRICICEYQWQYLPWWAQRFVARTEGCLFRPMTGAQAFAVLASLESSSFGFEHSQRAEVPTPVPVDVTWNASLSQAA